MWGRAWKFSVECFLLAGATNEIQGQTSFVDVGALRAVHKKTAKPLTTFMTGVNGINRPLDNDC